MELGNTYYQMFILKHYWGEKLEENKQGQSSINFSPSSSGSHTPKPMDYLFQGEDAFTKWYQRAL